MRGGATSGVSKQLLFPPPAKISERLHGSSRDKLLKDAVLQLHGEKPLPSPHGCGAGMHGASAFPLPACARLGGPGSRLRSGSRGSSRPPLQDPYQRHERMPLRGRPLRSAARGHASRRRKDIMVYFIARPEVLGSSPSSSQPSRGWHGVRIPAGSSGSMWIRGAGTADCLDETVVFGHYSGYVLCFRV